MANTLVGVLESGQPRVGILAEARREYAELHFAAGKVGVTLINLNMRAVAEELAPLLEEADPGLVLFSDTTAPIADALRELSPGRQWIRFGQGRGGFEEFITGAATVDPQLDVDAESIHSVVFTSGSTGTPKGVLISHRAAVARGAEKAAALGLTGNDGYVMNVPMFHIGGDVPLYASTLIGARFGILPNVEAAPMFELIAEHGLTTLTFPPAGQVLMGYIDHLRAQGSPGTSLRAAEGQGDPIPPDVLSELTGRLHIPYRDSYGMSEVSTVLGRWVGPGQVPTYRKDPFILAALELVDDRGVVIDAATVDVVGELVVRSPMVTSGYLNQPEATVQAMASGWFRTGDLFHRDDAGAYRFTERKSYVIRSGGENVYPAEIERVLKAAPGVAEVIVVGMDDRTYGRVPKAFIVPNASGTTTVAKVEAFARQHLAGLKRPKVWEFVTAADIPRTPLGKVLRKELERRKPVGQAPDEPNSD